MVGVCRVGYLRRMAQQLRGVGEHLREWRLRRRMSQLDLALEADISTRHLSFLETGRAQPSRDMILHLAERLDVPLRERNLLLTAAGYASVFHERSLDDPTLVAVRTAIDPYWPDTSLIRPSPSTAVGTWSRPTKRSVF